MFKSQFGSMLPARIYTSDSGTSHFKVTVVDYNNIEAIATEKAKTCPPGAETCKGGGSSTGVGYWKADIEGAVIITRRGSSCSATPRLRISGGTTSISSKGRCST